MSSVLTIRDVPDSVKEALAEDARERGQSLQGLLLGLVQRQAAFSRNQQVLDEVQHELISGGGAGSDAPDAAAVLEQERGTSEPA